MNMIERVARASFEAWTKRRGLDHTFEDLSADEHEFALLHAKAIIEAMREPTEAMLRATYPEQKLAFFLDFWGATHVWQAMIDEALK